MRRDADQPVACTEQWLHPQRRTHTLSHSDIRTQTHTGSRAGWEEADNSRRHWSDSAGPTRGLCHGWFFMGVLLCLGALLALNMF